MYICQKIKTLIKQVYNVNVIVYNEIRKQRKGNGTMDKREIMKRAHQIARTLEGHYHARLSLALRMAWVEAKAASQPKQLPHEVSFVYEGRSREVVTLRLNRWTKYGKDRIYVEEVRGRGFLKIGFFDLVEGRWNPEKLTNPVLNRQIREAVIMAARQAGLVA